MKPITAVGTMIAETTKSYTFKKCLQYVPKKFLRLLFLYCTVFT